MDDLSKMTARVRHAVTGGDTGGGDDLPTGDGLPTCGGGGVIYTNDINDTAILYLNAYADAACTEWLTYEQGKAIVSKPYVLAGVAEGYDLTMITPLATFYVDEEKGIGVTLVNVDPEGNLSGVMRVLVFADTPILSD